MNAKYRTYREITHAMRPLQERSAQLIIQDVLSGNPPVSIEEACQRYRDSLGEAEFFDNGNSWNGDIRDAAVTCLISWGFERGGSVKETSDGQLTDWAQSQEDLQFSAALEYSFGGNRRLANLSGVISEKVISIGSGPEAVYVYTDSLLDEHGHRFCKIGRHLDSSIASVRARVFSQYGTGNPGIPVLRLIAKCQSSSQLEAAIHRQFRKARVSSGIGTEWFACSHAKVHAELLTLLGTAGQSWAAKQ